MRDKLRDFLLYCVIGVSIVGILGVYGFHEGKLGHTSGLPVKWLGFAILTAFIFGNAIRYTKPFWGLPRFWGLLALFAVFHFGVGLAVLSRVTTVGLVDFLIVTPIEYFALDVYLSHFLNRKQ